MEPILEVKNLTKHFNDFSLKDVSFSLESGFIMGFIGPNGAGKSTTIKLIMNLLKKDGGEIKVFGLDHIKHEQEIKNNIGFVYDENYFYEELTIEEMKRIISPFYKNWDNSMFESYIQKFNLPKDRKIKNLSKGMKMKFSLTVALSHDAKLLIMDEPTSGLDPIVRREFLDILYDIVQDENRGIFFSSHITSDLDKIADFVTLIDDGKVLLSTSKENILDNYALVKGPKELITGETEDYFIGIKQNQFGFEGLTNDRNTITRLLKDKTIVEKPSLEDILFYYSRGHQNV